MPKRADGRYEHKVTLPDGRRKSVYGATRAEAANKRNELLRQIAAGMYNAAPVETVGDFLTRWLEDVKRPNIAPGTYIDYAGIIRKHLMPAIGTINLTDLTPAHVQRLLSDLGRADLSAAAINKVHVVLYGALKQAMRWDLVPRNVASLVSPPKVERAKRERLTADQARAFLAAARDHPLEALFVLALTSGLREGELLGLRWDDVDFERRTVMVTQALRRDYEGRSMGDPKSRTSRRQVSIPEVAIAALRRHKARQAEQRLRASVWHDNGLVFTARNGQPYRPQTLRDRQFYPLLDRAGLPRLTFHSLRHTFATLGLEQGIGLKVISEMLGHSGIAITADVYLHVSEEAQRAAADRLDSLFGGGESSKKSSEGI